MSEPEEYSDEDYVVGEEEMPETYYCCDNHCDEEEMSESDHYCDEHYEEEHMTDPDDYCDAHYEEMHMEQYGDEHHEEDYVSDPEPYGDEQYEEVEAMSEAEPYSDENFSRLVAETEERVATLTAERKCLMKTIEVLEADVDCLKAVLDVLEDNEQEHQDANEMSADPDSGLDSGSSPTRSDLATTTDTQERPSSPSLSEVLSQARNEIRNCILLRDANLSAESEHENDDSDGEMFESGQTSNEENEGVLLARVLNQTASLVRHAVANSSAAPAPRQRPARRRSAQLIVELQRPETDDQLQETFEDHVARLQLIEITDSGDPVTGDNNPHVCSTCVTNKISYMVTPCNHVSLCGPCVRIHRQGLKSDEGVLLNYVRCPNCAQKVEGYTRVFL